VPFHPERFAQFLTGAWTNGSLLRCKGYFWLANRFLEIGSVSQAGGQIRYGYIGRWWRFLPDEEWPRDEERRSAIEEHWDPLVGDCRQEIVFIGQDLDFDKLHSQLDCCLLTIEEVEEGVDAWVGYHDPLGSGISALVT
jgi:G3E family GTPase